MRTNNLLKFLLKSSFLVFNPQWSRKGQNETVKNGHIWPKSAQKGLFLMVFGHFDPKICSLAPVGPCTTLKGSSKRIVCAIKHTWNSHRFFANRQNVPFSRHFRPNRVSFEAPIFKFSLIFHKINKNL